MRLRVAFLSCTIAAAGALAAAPATAGDIPTSCKIKLVNEHGTPNGDTYTVNVVSGPALSSCNSPSGQCTAISYQVTGSVVPERIGVLEGVGVVSADGGASNIVHPPCHGDKSTELGKNSCHEQAIGVVPDGSTTNLKVTLDGARSTSPTSLVVVKGLFSGTCVIEGTGLDDSAGPFQNVFKIETNVFEGCAVTFKFDSSGNVVSAVNDPKQSDPTAVCSPLVTTTIDKLTVTLDIPGQGPTALGAGQFGDGYISSGSASCTSRVVAGRVYTWGAPCP
jgi:hypothetical protein